jgi:putative copper export protein
VSYTGGVILGILAVGILVLAAAQISEYWRKHTIISPRQFALRMVMAVLLLATIGGIYMGALVRWPSPVAELGYWIALMVVACVIVLLAMRDLRMLERVRHQRRAELFRRLADLEETLREPKDSGK